MLFRGGENKKPAEPNKKYRVMSSCELQMPWHVLRLQANRFRETIISDKESIYMMVTKVIN